MTDPNNRVVPVEIQNWSEIQNWADKSAKYDYVKNTTLHTYILDTAGVAGPKNIQICDLEPRRCRLAIQVIDAPVALCLEQPVNSPDTSSASLAPTGTHLANTASFVYEFFGPDAFWLNIIGPGPTTTRVTVTKEYR